MQTVKLSKLEYQLMEVLWKQGRTSVREIQQAFPAKRTLAYTTVQTTLFRMERKGIIRRAGQIGSAYLFEALVTKENAERALIEDLLSMFGGSSQPVMAHLIDSGRLSLQELRNAEETLRLKTEGKKN